jgi:hypothetical protein
MVRGRVFWVACVSIAAVFGLALLIFLWCTIQHGETVDSRLKQVRVVQAPIAIVQSVH